jgi:ABC-type uncharacterized transport system substrate-binding protein
VSYRRPFIGMFFNLADGDREISARREAFLRGFGAMPGLTIATRFGDGDFGSYYGKAQALSALRVDGSGPDLYLATCWPSLRALTQVAGNTPIVFAGLANLGDHPATDAQYPPNVYGFISYGKNLCEEWVRLLRTVKPEVQRAAVLYDMNPDRPRAKRVYDAIKAHGLALSPELKEPREINCGSDTLEADLQRFVSQEEATPAGLIVGVSVLAAKKRKTIIEFARTNRLPVVYPNRLYTLSGGLVSKGTYIQGLYRSSGIYARKIINREQPSPRIDITQTGLDPDPNKMAVFETVINASAARAIGLRLDPAALRADLVIDEG